MADAANKTRCRRIKGGVPVTPKSDHDAVISVRIPIALKDRCMDLRYGPYRIGITDIVIRGIELALAEAEKSNG